MSDMLPLFFPQIFTEYWVLCYEGSGLGNRKEPGRFSSGRAKEIHNVFCNSTKAGSRG